VRVDTPSAMTLLETIFIKETKFLAALKTEKT
jgi:hypothetical protein